MTFRYGCSFGTRLDMFALFLQSILFGTVCSLFLETANFVESNNDHTVSSMLHHTLVGIGTTVSYPFLFVVSQSYTCET